MYKLLENPSVYNLFQKVFAPGYKGELERILRDAVGPYRDSIVLELGAGTGVFSPRDFVDFTATDINAEYLREIKGNCKLFCCDSQDLPFQHNTFDLVFAVGLYHHLSDLEFHRSLKSVISVLKPGGVFMVLDNIWPTNKFNLIAYLIRKFDRGKYVRTLSEQKEILDEYFAHIIVNSGYYTFLKLEYIFFICHEKKSKND